MNVLKVAVIAVSAVAIANRLEVTNKLINNK